MALNEKFFEALAAVANISPAPLGLTCPIPGNSVGSIVFTNFAEWQAFLLRLRLPDDVPQRAQKQYLLGRGLTAISSRSGN
jgi:hypothetical protein